MVKRYKPRIKMRGRLAVSRIQSLGDSNPLPKAFLWIFILFLVPLLPTLATGGPLPAIKEHILLIALTSPVLIIGAVAYTMHRAGRMDLKLLRIDPDALVIGRYGVSDKNRKSYVPREPASNAGRSQWRSYSRSLHQTFTFKGRNATKRLDWSRIEKLDLVDSLELSGMQRWLCIEMQSIHEEILPAVYKIKWENVLSGVAVEEFFNELRSKAPDALSEDLLDAVKEEPEDVKYTHLWLKYFSTPADRDRKGALPKGSKMIDGTYEVEEVLGAGGQGTAYLARTLKPYAVDVSKELPERVVLKEYILPVYRGEDLAQNKSYDLNQEAKILGQIDHPAVVSLLDCFVEDHRGYLVLEYVDGESLLELIKREGVQNEKIVCQWTGEICKILSYLHGLSPAVIHRDLTPDNLMLQKDGHMKLMDFTVAHQLESKATATMVGKHGYIPPEQFSGESCPASDIYALGCTMHYLLTGKEPEPLEASNPSTFNDTVSDEVSTIVKRATALDLEERYKSAEDLNIALESIKTKK